MPPRYRPPREFFGFGAQPLSGNEKPPMSPNVAERFDRAGLGAFTPYVSPYETIARAQQYKDFDQAMGVRDMEDQFWNTIQENPQNGAQKFLAANPMALQSPMIRSYAITQQRLNKPTTDPFLKDAASGGTDSLNAYLSGGGGPAGFAAAQDVVTKAKREAKPERPWQQRLSESEREKVRSTVASVKSAPEDFTSEFETHGGGMSEDDYVKKFKGDPSFEAYKQRRTAERAGPVIADLIDNYGLTDEEARGLVGIGPKRGEVPVKQAPVQVAPVEMTSPEEVPMAAPEAVAPPPMPVPSLNERAQQQGELTPKEISDARNQTKQLYDMQWTAAKDELSNLLKANKDLKFAGDDQLLQGLLRSVQKNEAILPSDVGLPNTKDPLGGTHMKNAADVLARALGKDPDAIAEVDFTGQGRKSPMVDRHTWRDVVKAWADQSLPQTAPSGPSSVDYSHLWGGK